MRLKIIANYFINTLVISISTVFCLICSCQQTTRSFFDQIQIDHSLDEQFKLNGESQLSENFDHHLKKLNTALKLDEFTILTGDSIGTSFGLGRADTLFSYELMNTKNELNQLQTSNMDTELKGWLHHKIDQLSIEIDSIRRDNQSGRPSAKYGLILICPLKIAFKNHFQNDTAIYMIDKNGYIMNREVINWKIKSSFDHLIASGKKP